MALQRASTPTGPSGSTPTSGFGTGADDCGTYGHDLEHRRRDHRRTSTAPDDPAGQGDPQGRRLRAPPEEPDDDYPLWLTTGRVVYHFHTRTKTGRSQELNDAAPDAFVQMHERGRRAAGASPRATWSRSSPAAARSAPRPGSATSIAGAPLRAVPLRLLGRADGRPRAANELTLTAWDPVSKQPHFKYAAVRVSKVQGDPKAAAIGPAGRRGGQDSPGRGSGGGRRPSLGKKIHQYLGLLEATEQQLGKALKTVAEHHPLDPEVRAACNKFAGWVDGHLAALKPMADRFHEKGDDEPKRLRSAIFQGPRVGALGLMRDVHSLWLLAQDAWIGWLALTQCPRRWRKRNLPRPATATAPSVA